MQIPKDNRRNVNPGALVSDRAWSNPGRNKPASSSRPDHGDPMAYKRYSIVRETEETRRTVITVQNPRFTVETVAAHRVTVEVSGQTETWKDIPSWAADDENIVVLDHIMVAGDGSAGKVQDFYTVAWREDCRIVEVEVPEHTVTKEAAGRVVSIRREGAPEMPAPDLEQIWQDWRAAQNRREVARREARAARKSSRGNSGFWANATVTGSVWTPE